MPPLHKHPLISSKADPSAATLLEVSRKELEGTNLRIQISLTARIKEQPVLQENVITWEIILI